MNSKRHKDPFTRGEAHADLGKSFVRGATSRVTATIVRVALNVSATMVLARILTPDDYGVIAMVLVVVGFLRLFKEFGLSIATVQKKDIGHNEVNSLFWINTGIGLVIAGVCAALAPVASWFYDEPRVLPVFAALGATFLMAGLSAQHQALLKRQMRFGVLAAIDLLATAAGIVVAIIVALRGGRHWALVWMQLVVGGLSAAGVCLLSKWRPTFSFRFAAAKDLLSFGGNYSGFVLLHHIARTSDRLLLAKVLGASTVGLYDRAYRLLLLPIQLINAPITDVTIPTLSRLQHDSGAFRAYFRKILNAATYLTATMIALLAVSSAEVIAIVLGDQWIEAGEVFRILAIAALAQPFLNIVGCALLSLGRAKLLLRLSLAYAPIYVGAFCIGLQWGARGVALAFVLCDYLVRLPLFLRALSDSPLTIRDCYVSLARPLTAAVVVCEGAVTGRSLALAANGGPALALVSAAAGGGMALLLAAALWKGLRVELAAIISKSVSSWMQRGEEEPASSMAKDERDS